MKTMIAVTGLWLMAGVVGLAQNKDPLDGSTPPALAPGTPTGTFPVSGIDQVNLFSGNLSVNIPLLQVGGRGDASYTIPLTIERRWYSQRSCIYNGYCTNSLQLEHFRDGLFSPGKIEVRHVEERTTECAGGPQNQVPLSTVTKIVFTGPDGTEHELRDEATGGKVATYQNSCSQPWAEMQNRGVAWRAGDGSQIRFIAATPRIDVAATYQATVGSGTILYPDGTTLSFASGNVTWLRDRNGNFVEFAYEDPLQAQLLTRVTDSLGRAVTIQYAPPGATLPKDTVIRYKGFGQTGFPDDRSIIIRYNSLKALRKPTATTEVPMIKELFPGPISFTASSGDLRLDPTIVAEVILPNSQKYAFRYNNYAEVERITLPTGGYVEYEHGGITAPNVDSYGWATNESILRRVKVRKAYLPGGVPEKTAEYTDNGGSALSIREKDGNDNLISLHNHFFYGNLFSGLSKGPMEYPKLERWARVRNALEKAGWCDQHSRREEDLVRHLLEWTIACE